MPADGLAGGPPARSPSRISVGRVLLLLGVGVLVILGLLRFSGGGSALRALGSVPAGSLLAMLAVFYLGMTLRVWRWHVLLRSLGHRVGLRPLGQLLLTGYFLNTVVPARAGDVARIFLVGRRHGVPYEAATGTLVMERALDVLVNLLGAAIAAYLVLPGLVPAEVAQLYLIAFLLVLGAVAALLAAPRLEERLLRLWRAPRYQALLKLGFGFLAALRRMASDWPRLLLALAQTALIWAIEIVLAGLALAALGSGLPLGRLVFLVLTVDLAGAIPLLPGGLGQIEAVYLSLLLLLGVARDSAGVTILLHRAVTFWQLMAVSGLVTLLGGTLTGFGPQVQGRQGGAQGIDWRASGARVWRRWGVVALLALSTALLMRGWLLHPLPNSPRQEALAELHITTQFLDDLRQGHVLSAWNPREFAGYPWLRFLAYPVYLGLAGLSYCGGIALSDLMKGFYFLAYWGSGLAMYAYVRRIGGVGAASASAGAPAAWEPPLQGSSVGAASASIKRAGLPRPAAFLAALAYQWYPFHAHVGGEAWIHAAFWALFPLALYLIERAVAAPRGRERYLWSLLLGVLLAALVVVTIEYTVFAAPFIALYILAREILLIRAGRESVPGSLARLAVTGAVALGLAAFFIVPALTSMASVGIHNKHAAGSTFSLDFLRGYSLSPSLVINAIAGRTHLSLPSGALPAVAMAFWSVAWYPGLIASPLVLVGVVLAFRARRLRLPALLLGLALLVALGPNLPGAVLSAIPILGRLTPYRALLFAIAFASPLFGFAGAWLLEHLPKPLPRLAGLALLVVLLLVDFAPAAAAFNGVDRYFSPAEEEAQTWLRAQADQDGLRLWEPRTVLRDEYRAWLDLTRTGMPRFWGYYDNGAPLYTWQLYNWAALETDLRLSSVRYALLDGKTVQDANLRQALANAGFRLVSWGGEGPYLFEDPRPLPYARAYPLAALSVAAQPSEDLHLLPALLERGVALVSGESPYLDDYTAAQVAPYAYLFVDGAAERQSASRPAWLDASAARLWPAAALDDLPAAAPVSDRDLRWQRPNSQEVRVQADLAAPALVSIAEAWYPHWRVAVDGQATPLLRVNYAFQGVWVGVGRHEIVFRYQRPALDGVAAAMSGITALGVLGAVWGLLRKKRSQ